MDSPPEFFLFPCTGLTGRKQMDPAIGVCAIGTEHGFALHDGNPRFGQVEAGDEPSEKSSLARTGRLGFAGCMLRPRVVDVHREVATSSRGRLETDCRLGRA